MKNTSISLIPPRFCWTRYGTESGENISSIFERKERERKANDGVFLWGIGNSVGPGIRRLVDLEKRPKLVFSPMLSRPKKIDVMPAQVVAWQRARALGGTEWTIPAGTLVWSRGTSGAGAIKHRHYALVCRSKSPVWKKKTVGSLDAGTLVNLVSGSPLGTSQVTCVVERSNSTRGPKQIYLITAVVDLEYPYFVELFDPEVVQVNQLDESVAARFPIQRSLLTD